MTTPDEMRLCQVLRNYRWATKQGLRELAQEIGTSHSTLGRIERGFMPDGKTLTKILVWLLGKEPDPNPGDPDHPDEPQYTGTARVQ